MKQLFIVLAFCVVSLTAIADETQQAINICPDRIIINTDSLHLPSSTSAYEILSLLPDLVDRVKDVALENYDVQINQETVGSARNAVLKQIRISDLKCIVVCENSLSSVSSMGQGGCIDFELRPVAKGLSGSVNAEVTTEAEYIGHLRLENKNDKWTVRGIATVDNYVPSDFNIATSTGSNTNRKIRNFSEMATAFIDYSPSANNQFELNVSEVYNNNRTYISGSGNDQDLKNNKIHNVDAYISLDYTHTFPGKIKLGLDLNYRFVPERCDASEINTDTDLNDTYDYNHNQHNIFGSLNLVLPLLRPSTNRYLNLEVGTQYNVAIGDNINENKSSFPGAKFRSDTITEQTYYLRPYIKMSAKFNKWQLYANIDNQYFEYRTEQMEESEMIISNITDKHYCDNITGQAVAMFSPNNRNQIRLRYVRSIKRPTSTQLLPILYYNILSGTYTRGNSSLVPMTQNAVDLDYTLNLSTADYHLEMKSSVEYSHAYDEIRNYNNGASSYISNTYINSGKSDVIMGDLSLYFRKNILSMWLSGNVYHKMDSFEDQDDKDHYTYYNVLLNAAVNFGRGWMASVSTTYNSSITTDSYKHGDMCYGILRIGKTWKRFNVYICGTQNFLGKEKDIMYAVPPAVDTTTEYDFMHSNYGVGVRYNF